ncbi:hypothetical protein R1sor_020402 [Riccia sorocarpa]|uniref:Protein kinase domain-containing protein n=1 Tax=Riccia sorocarpa TaxID=122646 RepID=A0ABD3IJ39_9MARC
MASCGQGRTEGRGNREREDRGKRPMVDPDPIRHPVEETFEESELASIIVKIQYFHLNDTLETNTAWVMMHKELASFAETHCAIVQPIACHNIEAEPILVYPYWNGRDIYQWMRQEHDTRGTRLPDNSGRSGNLITDNPKWFPDPEDFETLHNWKNVEIFRARRLEIMCTLWSVLDFMHEHNWLHCDIHRLVILGWPNKCMLRQATMVSPHSLILDFGAIYGILEGQLADY